MSFVIFIPSVCVCVCVRVPPCANPSSLSGHWRKKYQVFVLSLSLSSCAISVLPYHSYLNKLKSRLIKKTKNLDLIMLASFCYSNIRTQCLGPVSVPPPQSIINPLSILLIMLFFLNSSPVIAYVLCKKHYLNVRPSLMFPSSFFPCLPVLHVLLSIDFIL